MWWLLLGQAQSFIVSYLGYIMWVRLCVAESNIFIISFHFLFLRLLSPSKNVRADNFNKQNLDNFFKKKGKLVDLPNNTTITSFKLDCHSVLLDSFEQQHAADSIILSCCSSFSC